MRTEDVLGQTGKVIVATRGADGPGEVQLHVGGSHERFLAHSPVPFPRGTCVQVTGLHGPRAVDVDLADPLDALDLPHQ